MLYSQKGTLIIDYVYSFQKNPFCHKSIFAVNNIQFNYVFQLYN